MNRFNKNFYWIWVAVVLVLGCLPAPETTSAEPQKVAQTAAAGNCPQDRKTPSAPKEIRDQSNPVFASDITLQTGKKLFENAAPLACKLCHGEQGDGKGDLDFASTPPARNFTCAATMKEISDGQLFWIIKNGSPNTSMPAFADLSEQDVWTLVFYIRRLSKTK
jgi:mono/diheme cytochrome c family protein